MPESVKKAVETKKTPVVKKTIQKKKPAVAATKASTTITKASTTTTEAAAGEDVKPKLTQGQKLLKSMTAQKAAKKALVKGVKTTRVSFDEDGNEATVETVIQKTAPPPAPTKKKTTNKNRPAMKKPEPKKRKAEEMDKEGKEGKKEETAAQKDNKKPPKKTKKPKKSKAEVEEQKKDSKQEEALNYVRLFVNDRDNWKFKKVQQIWLLSNLYEIPEDEFDNVLEYLKDLQGSAREKAKKEAEEKIPKKKTDESTTPQAPVISHALTGYAGNANDNDDDDFDAEKLLAQATMAPVAAPVSAAESSDSEDDEEEEEEEEEDETLEIKRAKLIINVLG